MRVENLALSVARSALSFYEIAQNTNTLINGFVKADSETDAYEMSKA